MDIRSSFGVGHHELPSLMVSVPNVIQSECLLSGLLSELGINPHNKPTVEMSEHDEQRFPDARIISWNMNGIQNLEKLRTLQKMVGSCRPLFILIQESHSNLESDLDLIRNQLRKYVWLRNNFSEKRRGLLIGVK